jgi:hypothetical protein
MRIMIPNRNRIRAMARDGRRRAESLRGSVPDVTMEDARHAVEELREHVEDLREQVEPLVGRALREQVEPLVDRALRRKRSRRGPAYLLVGLLAAVAVAAVAYLLWKRDDEQPAYLVDEPERPDITPATPIVPSGGAPSTPEPTSDGPDVTPSAPSAPSPIREAVGARGWTPATNSTSTEDRPSSEPRASRPSGISLPASAGAPFAAARDLLPGRGNLGLPRFPR